MIQPHEATPKQLRSFGLLVGAIFALISLWPVIWRGEMLRVWAIIAAVVLITINTLAMSLAASSLDPDFWLVMVAITVITGYFVASMI